MTSKHILVINPGSTSTKLAFFQNDQKLEQENIKLEAKAAKMPLWDQFESRLETVRNFIRIHRINKLDAVSGRGGLLKPVSRGTYAVNDIMIKDARKGIQGRHASNLGCALAEQIARQWQSKAYIVDPVCVDEMEPLARYSGHPLLVRKALSHALNIGAVTTKRAKELKKGVHETRFVVVHMGGGISVAAVKGGHIIDVNDAAGDGPFTPERSGSLPMQQFTDLCFSGQYTKENVKQMIMGNGGLKAYLGTSDVVQIEKSIRGGDETASEIVDAMIYQISKEIAAMGCVLYGKVDNIILTGGLTNSMHLVESISKRTEFIAPIVTYAGEFEMEALALGVWRVLIGKEDPKEYK